jgi:lipoate---protein ligase
VNFEVIDTGINSAKKNMEIDKNLLKNLIKKSIPMFHFYDWIENCATFGYFIDIKNFINLSFAKKNNIQFAKRPTGGGIIFHVWDMAFSFLMPSNHKFFSKNVLQNYKFVNELVLNAVCEFQKLSNPYLTKNDFLAKNENSKYFCMARPTKYDVILDGKKIAGAAQRSTKDGYLHQGSISIMMPDENLLNNLFLENTNVTKQILSNTFCLLKSSACQNDFINAKINLKKLLIKCLEKKLSYL